MAIQIGKYKRPGIFIEEIDKSIITSPTVFGFANLVIGFSKKGPVNTAVLLRTAGDMERVFGGIDRQLERKGSWFHRTISLMLISSPVYAINLLLTDDALDVIEYQSISATPVRLNDSERLAPYRKFFDTTGFWKRDTDSFIEVTKANLGYDTRVINLTNLSDKYISVFVVKSQMTGFDRPLIEWYGSKEKLPPYVYATDLASDYMVDVVVIGGDWSNYGELAADPRWEAYFTDKGLKKDQLRNFANDRNITTLAYYDGLSLIPYFRDANGRNIFIESVVNRDTDRTGLFCAFNTDIYETDYPKGLVDLVGNSLVDDDLLSNPPTSEETYYQSLESIDGKSDGELGIKFLSYEEQITDTQAMTNVVLDRPGNVLALFGSNSALKANSGRGTFTHSLNAGSTPSGGVIFGDSGVLGHIAHKNRTYWFTEGYVNDLYRHPNGFTTTTQSVTLEYIVPTTSANGYAVIGGNRVLIDSGTYSVVVKSTSFQQSAVTQSYNLAYVLNTSGTIEAKLGSTSSFAIVSATDIVLGFGTVSLYNGNFLTYSLAPKITDLTIGTQTGGGSNAYIPLVYGIYATTSDYNFSTQSTPQIPLSEGDVKVTLWNTKGTPTVNDYQAYRKFKLFNSMLTYINSSASFRGLMLLSPKVDTTKKSLMGLTVSNVATGTTVDKSFVIKTGLQYSEISDILSDGELVFYKTDDEFLIDYAGLETKNTLPVLDKSTASFGVVGKYSLFYNRFDQGLISTGDVFFQNELYEGVQVKFVPGSSVTASLAGYNYVVFRLDNQGKYIDENESYFSKINDYQADDSGVQGYQMIIGGVNNSGTFTIKYDEGLTVENGLRLPFDASGESSVDGRAYLLYEFSNGQIVSENDGTTYSYFAYEVIEPVVEETLNITKLYGYSNDFVDAPLYLQNYTDGDGNLKVTFTKFNLATQSTIASIETTNDGLETNGTLFIKSQLSNYKQTLEIEEPEGYVPSKNKVLVKRSRYPEVKVGDYLEAYYDASLLQDDEMPKKITRILSKKVWTTNPDYVELACDATIKVRIFNGDKQTTRFTKVDDYVKTYKAISLKGFRIREESMPDGTDERQTEILNVLAKGTTLFKALTNKEGFDFRYLIDGFGLGLTPNSKQQLVDICGDRLDAFGIINMPSLKHFRNSVNPSFKDAGGTLQISYIANGGDPEGNSDFFYSFGKGPGVTSVGYFLPYVTIDDFGRLVDCPPAGYVGLTFMRKHNTLTSTITPWSIAAGVNNGRIFGILDLEQIFTPSDIEFLNLAQMNPLTFKRNRGFVIETENTAQVLYKSALSYIHVREVLIELERELSRMLLDFQWTFNTPEIRSQIKLKADTICDKYVAQNGLFNYFNKIDEENNTAEIIDNQIGVLDTYVEPIKGMGIIVNNITILRTGAISAGGFINP